MWEVFTPSPRQGGAQRILSATSLVVEGLVLFFAILVAHQLSPETRALMWGGGLVLVVAFILCAGMLRRGAWAYVLGLLLQIPLILAGFVVTPMWAVGAAFALLYVFGIVKGHQLDKEKDAIDARWFAEHGGADGTRGADGTDGTHSAPGGPSGGGDRGADGAAGGGPTGR